MASPASIPELRTHAANWSFEDDQSLLLLLTNFSADLDIKFKDIEAKIDASLNSCAKVKLKVQQANNTLELLGSCQFIERRVYEDDDVAHSTAPVLHPRIDPIDRVKAFNNGLSALQCNKEVSYTLPALIGSKAFIENSIIMKFDDDLDEKKLNDSVDEFDPNAVPIAPIEDVDNVIEPTSVADAPKLNIDSLFGKENSSEAHQSTIPGNPYSFSRSLFPNEEVTSGEVRNHGPPPPVPRRKVSDILQAKHDELATADIPRTDEHGTTTDDPFSTANDDGLFNTEAHSSKPQKKQHKKFASLFDDSDNEEDIFSNKTSLAKGNKFSNLSTSKLTSLFSDSSDDEISNAPCEEPSSAILIPTRPVRKDCSTDSAEANGKVADLKSKLGEVLTASLFKPPTTASNLPSLEGKEIITEPSAFQEEVENSLGRGSVLPDVSDSKEMINGNKVDSASFQILNLDPFQSPKLPSDLSTSKIESGRKPEKSVVEPLQPPKLLSGSSIDKTESGWGNNNYVVDPLRAPEILPDSLVIDTIEMGGKQEHSTISASREELNRNENMNGAILSRPIIGAGRRHNPSVSNSNEQNRTHEDLFGSDDELFTSRFSIAKPKTQPGRSIFDSDDSDTDVFSGKKQATRRKSLFDSSDSEEE